ncbi:lactate utilization protein [Desulfonauticus submarinus]
MKDFVKKFWELRLLKVKEALEKNNFEVYLVKDELEAKNVVLNELLPAIKPKSLSWGGSMTFVQTGLYDSLKQTDEFEIFDTYDKSLSSEDILEKRRRALLVDLFFTGTNAITEDGWLVNLDMIGNRVGALTFGPKKVIVLAGKNKIVSDLDEAMLRIKTYSAPANTMRLNKKTPCFKTGFCHDCSSPDRICNVWSIIEKCYPQKRISVILISKDLGL